MPTRNKVADDVRKILVNIFNSFEQYYVTKGQRDFVSLEYFSIVIFESLFSKQFENINAVNNNSEYIDLISADKEIGVQVTFEKPNRKKIEKSEKAFEKYGIKKLIVFFFVLSKTSLKGEKNNSECWTINNVIDKAQGLSGVSSSLLKNLELWKDETSILPSSFIPKLNSFAVARADEIIRLRNENENLFVADLDEQKMIDLFCSDIYAEAALNMHKDVLIKSPLLAFYSSVNDEEATFFKTMNESTDYSVFDVEQINDHQASLLEKYRSSEEGREKNDCFQYTDRSLGYKFTRIIELSKVSKNQMYAVVRTAAQGKTVLCIQAVRLFEKRNQPCVFIPSFLDSGSYYPYDSFKGVLSNVIASTDYKGNLFYISSFLKQSGKSIVIMIDGFNEYKDKNKAIGDIGKIFRDFQGVGFEPKILITSRNRLFDDFSGRLASKTRNNSIYKREVAYVNNKEVWEKYFNHYEITVRPNYRLQELFNQNRLFISIYCELYKEGLLGNGSVPDQNDFYERYFNRRARIDFDDGLFADEEEFFEAATLLSKRMINNKNFVGAPLSSFSLDEREKIRKLANDVYSIKDDKEVKYSLDEYRDYFLKTQLWDKDLGTLNQVYSSSDNLEGLFRMIVFARTSNPMEQRDADYKNLWYAALSLDVMSKYGTEGFKAIDEKAMIDLFAKTIEKNQKFEQSKSLMVVLLFLEPYVEERQFFTPGRFPIDKDAILKKVRVLPADFLFKQLNGYLKRETIHLSYFKELIQFLMKAYDAIPFYLQESLRGALGKTLNVSKPNHLKEKLMANGFEAEECDYVGAKK